MNAVQILGTASRVGEVPPSRRAKHPSDWVVEAAADSLPRTLPPGDLGQWEAWWHKETRRVRTAELVGLVVLLQLLTFMLLFWPWSVIPKLQPHMPASLQANLWQVDAGLVTVALPVFLVILQYSSTLQGSIAALPVSEVLRRESVVVPTLIIAGIGFLRCGADAIWFQGDAVLFLDFFLIFLFTLAALGFSFYRLFSIAGNPTELSIRAERLLRWKLESAIDHSWSISKGNQTLIEAISAIKAIRVTYSPLAASLINSDWTAILVSRSMRIDDINSARLVDVILGLPAGLTSTSESASIDQTVSNPSEPDVYLCRLVGDTAPLLTPLIALRKSSFGDVHIDQVTQELFKCVKGTDIVV